MEIINFIENAEVICAILEHLGIWLVRSRPPPRIHAPPTSESADLRNHPHQQTGIYPDPDYSWDEYILS